MAGDWRAASLADLYEFSSGLSKPREDFGFGFPFLSFKDVFGNYFVPSKLEQFVNSSIQDRMTCSIKRGDVFLTRTSETLDELGMSSVALVDLPEATFNGFTKRLRPKDATIHPEYAGYYFRSNGFRKQLYALSNPSTRASLNNEMIARLTITVPSFAEQKAIAEILKPLDDKIEVNRKMVATLEAMARALFKSWFVDFDPVRAKAEGRDPGLPPHLAAVFPARLVETEAGEIPEGWPLEPLGRHIKATKGVSYQGEGLVSEGVPLHNLNSIYEGGGYKYEGIKYYAGEYKPHHVVRPGGVIVANTEQGHDRLLIGYAAVVPSLFGEFGIASHHIYILTPRPGSPLRSKFLCTMLNSPRMHDTVSGYANGTTVNMLPEDGLQMPVVVIPPLLLIQTFETLADNGTRRCEEMVAETHTLTALRDTLLPKLISGEFRVKDAEAFLRARE